MSIFDQLFGGGEKKASKAQLKANAAAREQYNTKMQPWIDRGNTAFGKYSGGLDKMENPGDFYDQIVQGYEPSKGFEFRQNKMLDTLANKAMATGTFGTGASQREMTDYINGILNEDLQRYIENYQGINNQYLEGEHGISNQGYEAGTNSALQNANFLNNEGKLKADMARAQSKGLTGMIGTLGTGAMDFYRGGRPSIPGGDFDWYGGLDRASEPYTSRGGANLSWMRNNGNRQPQNYPMAYAPSSYSPY